MPERSGRGTSVVGGEAEFPEAGRPSPRESAERSGTRDANGRRFLLVRPEVLANVQKQLEQTVGLSSRGFLYLAGERSAKEILAQGAPRPGLPLGQAIRHALETLGDHGWGRFELIEEAPEPRRWRIALEDSALASAYGPSKTPVCHLVAGWLAGLVERLSGQPILCEEASCRAQGRPRCEFGFRTSAFP